MPRRQKFQKVMSVIEQRIRQGDYVLNPIPGERKIAEETGVSHMTARKAVRGLLERKLLIRRPNGLLDVHPGHQADTGLSARTHHWKDTATAGHSRIESQTKSTDANLTNAPDGTAHTLTVRECPLSRR